MTINQTITINASAASVYQALISAALFSQVTSAPARISPEEGGEFSCFGEQITGRHIELRPNHRIVQAWRVAAWPKGTWSLVRIDLSESGDMTTLDLEHTGFPENAAEHLEDGWHRMYWQPLKTFLE